jgi:hypothetical protein
MSIQMREGVVVRASESGTPAATVHAQNGQLSHLCSIVSVRCHMNLQICIKMYEHLSHHIYFIIKLHVFKYLIE